MNLREPLLVPLASITAGIVAAHFYPVALRPCLLVVIVFGALAAVIPGLRFFLAILACFPAGAALLVVHALPPPPVLSVADGNTALFSGCVVQPGLTGLDRERFTLELDPSSRAQVSLFTRDVSLFTRDDEEFPVLPYGTVAEVEGKARRPRNFQNPGAFDNEHYLARQQVYWNISARSDKVHLTGASCGNPVRRALFTIRGAALRRLEQLYRGDAYTTGIMEAVLVGVTSKVDRLWTEDYRRTGTYHALVISGSHIAVVASVFLFFLRLLGAPRGLSLAAGVAAAWLYAGIAGLDPPVVRSAGGMTLFAIGGIFYRKARLLNLLAATALLFIVVDPDAIFDASFQLSFLAVALIAAFAVPLIEATSGPLAQGLTDLSNVRRDIHFPPRVAQFRVEMRLLAATIQLFSPLPPRAAQTLVGVPARLLFYVWEIFLTSAFIQIGLALPMIVFFHRLPASGLTANVLVVPALSAVVPIGFAAILFNSAWFALIAKWLLLVSQWAAGFHARWEPDWRIPQPPVWLAVAFTIALILAAVRYPRAWPRWAARSTRTTAWTAVAGALALLVVYPFRPAFTPGELELAVLDVGQGDSILAALPEGRLILIDAGGIPSFGSARKSALDIGEDVVSPWLWSRSVRRLDIVVMTHAHTDHAGGLIAVLKNFRPRELWTGATSDNPAWNEISQAARNLGITVRTMHRAEPFVYGGVGIQVLAPSVSYIARPAPHNDDSLVLRLAFGTTSFLLTGDMEKDIELQLLGVGVLRHTDVVKIGHHGSRTSTTPAFLEALSPTVGLISAGYRNSYGHPHPTVLRSLSDHAVSVYRTDENGLIDVRSNGRQVFVNAVRRPPPAAAISGQ